MTSTNEIKNRISNSYVSEYNTPTTTFTGPLAIVHYEGPRNEKRQMHGIGKILFANSR